MIFPPSWPPKWKKIGSAKKLLNLGIWGKGCTYKHSKMKKRLRYLLTASRGSNLMTFTPSWAS